MEGSPIDFASRWFDAGGGVLAGAPARQHHGDGAGKDGEVQGRAPTVRIAEVELDPLLIAAGAAPAHLPEAGDAGGHAEATELVLFRELVEVARQHGPRADQAHVPDEDVHELRELVEAEAPQEPSRRRDP